MSTGPRPCGPDEAVARALAIVAARTGQYVLGSGDYRPEQRGDETVDLPWTTGPGGLVGSDCAGFAICYAYKLPRHRPGFAPGRVPMAYQDQLDVDDDINVNSAIEDALTVQELFRVVAPTEVPGDGDLLCYPSIQIVGHDMEAHRFVGHVAIVVNSDRYVGAGYTCASRRWDTLQVAQCHGPNGFTPGAVLTDGSIWLRHDADWPKVAHRTFLLRVVQS